MTLKIKDFCTYEQQLHILLLYVLIILVLVRTIFMQVHPLMIL